MFPPVGFLCVKERSIFPRESATNTKKNKIDGNKEGWWTGLGIGIGCVYRFGWEGQDWLRVADGVFMGFYSVPWIALSVCGHFPLAFPVPLQQGSCFLFAVL